VKIKSLHGIICNEKVGKVQVFSIYAQGNQRQCCICLSSVISLQQVWHRIKGGLNIKNDWEGISLNACYDSWVKKERKYITLPPLLVGLYGWNVIRNF
jgi:hypothetical protein